MAKGKISDEKIRDYALKNAVEHEGKAILSSGLSPLFAEGLEKEDVKEIVPKINKIINEINKLRIEEQKKEYEKIKSSLMKRETRDINELPELENVPKTGIITRFSPSSSASAFHIGHILTGMPSSLYVKKYGGKFYLRIEDTNPVRTVPECYDSFPKEADWIFGNISEWYAQSDRMQKYYDFAVELIKKGLAFVCTCKKQEESEESNLPRQICDCRNRDIKENLELWKKMLDKKGFKKGEAVLRFKTDLDDKNPAMLDFPLARINLGKHVRQDNKYRVWPLMNLCVTLDDIEFKITHIIRAKEHRDNAKRQEIIFDALKIKKPLTYFLGRYKFPDLPISKTQITELINKGNFKDWDDIRLPLARNFKRRGYQPEAFAKMATQRGLSEVDKVISQKDLFQVLDNFNREIVRDRAIMASWEESKKGKISLLMPDANIVKGNSDLKLNKLKDADIIFFRGFGYCRFNAEEKVKFWFAHR